MKKNNAVYLIVLAALLPVLLLRDYTPSNELRYLSIVDEALRERRGQVEQVGCLRKVQRLPLVDLLDYALAAATELVSAHAPVAGLVGNA